MSSGAPPGLPVIVVGLGAMGSATAYQLAKRGARVIGIDQYRPPHKNGSHCGETRITRKAIGEGEMYVPLVLRAYEIWREIEEAMDETLLEITGGLWISSAKPRAETHVSNFFANTVAAARRFGIAHELLDATAIRSRFPIFKVRDDEHAYFEPEAGLLRPEACVRAQLELAVRSGAQAKLDERVERIEQRGNEVRVVTANGEYAASRAVICAGAGALDLLPPEMSRMLTVTQQVQYWFEAQGHEELPVWIWELQNREHGVYGFPSRGGLAKIATETYTGELATSYVHDALVAPNLEGIGRCVKTVPCLYTATPDFHFLIDRHPSMDRVIVASPCSGHGFKHSAAIGEALAERLLEGRSTMDLSPFALSRFAGDGHLSASSSNQ